MSVSTPFRQWLAALRKSVNFQAIRKSSRRTRHRQISCEIEQLSDRLVLSINTIATNFDTNSVAGGTRIDSLQDIPSIAGRVELNGSMIGFADVTVTSGTMANPTSISIEPLTGMPEVAKPPNDENDNGLKALRFVSSSGESRDTVFSFPWAISFLKATVVSSNEQGYIYFMKGNTIVQSVSMQNGSSATSLKTVEFGNRDGSMYFDKIVFNVTQGQSVGPGGPEQIDDLEIVAHRPTINFLAPSPTIERDYNWEYAIGVSTENPVPEDISFRLVTVGGSATTPQDYSHLNKVFVIPKGNMAPTETPIINIVGDDIDETASIENLFINIQPITPPDAARFPQTSTLEVLLIDDDADVIPPSTTSFQRFSPNTSLTNTDSLTFRVTFNEPVTGIDPGDFEANGTTATVTLVSPAPGSNGTQYDVTLSGGNLHSMNGTVGLNFNSPTINDLAGNSLPNVEPPVDETYLVDNTRPSLTAIFPNDDATRVPTNASLIMGFSETVQAGSGNIVIYSNGVIFDTIPVSSSRVTVGGNWVTIDPLDFNEGTNYNIIVPENAFLDQAGNGFIGILQFGLWSFTIGDFTRPVLTAISPQDNDTGVSTNANIIMGFSESVQAGSGNILVYSNGVIFDTIPVNSPRVTVDGHWVTINPIDFAELTNYYIIVPEGAIKDATGNGFIGILQPGLWNFTTGDFTAPLLTSISPLDNAVEVPVNAPITLGFAEPVQAGTGIIRLRFENGQIAESFSESQGNLSFTGKTVTLHHISFAADTHYYVEVPPNAITDISGNQFIGIMDPGLWDFRTVVDAVPPQLISISPLDNATGVPHNAAITLGFNELVVKGAGYIVIKRSSDNSLFQSVEINSPSVTITQTSSGSLVEIAHLPFEPSTGYYIEVPNTVLLDLSSNAFIGIAGSTLWNFVTA